MPTAAVARVHEPSTLELAAIRTAKRSSVPYDYLVGPGFLNREAIREVSRDFPDITKPGYLTVDEVDLKGRFKALVEELEGADLTEELSRRFGLDLHPYPRLTTVMRYSALKHGAIHTDGPSKVMTLLVYLNEAWAVGDGGRLRVLYDDKAFEPYACEVAPLMGTVFAFLRSDHSWHGHRPFKGERRVVQVAWLKSTADLERKRRRNHFAQVLKGMFWS